MRRNIDKLPELFNTHEPPARLFDKVMFRLDRERKIAAVKKRLIIFSNFLLISAAASLPVWNTLRIELARSGFGQYLTLLFYDFRLIATHWQNYGLTLLETLPAASLASALAILLIMLFSLRLVVRYGHALLKLSYTHSH